METNKNITSEILPSEENEDIAEEVMENEGEEDSAIVEEDES